MLRTGNLRPGQKWESSVIYEAIPVGVLSCNCSILGDEETGEAVVIDPGDDIEQVREILERHKLKVKLLIATRKPRGSSNPFPVSFPLNRDTKTGGKSIVADESVPSPAPVPAETSEPLARIIVEEENPHSDLTLIYLYTCG